MSQSSSKPYRVAHASISDVGMRRANNQDSLMAVVDEDGGERCRGHVFIVADGMGAHAAGELASKLAVDSVTHAYRKQADAAPPAALRRAVQEANDRIFAKGQSSPELNGMGTTCTCLVLLPGTAMVAHVGDSRVYRVRGATLEQLTFDHSLVWEMAAASQVSADKVPACIPKNVITRSLGPHESVNVDLEGPTVVEPGDTFLLCSDGLSGVVADDEIGAVISAMPPDDAAQTLVDLANLRGGPDNISVIVVRVEEDEGEAKAAPADEVFKGIGRVHVLAWLGMLVCLAAVLVASAYQHPVGALLATTGFGASLIVAVMQHKNPVRRALNAELGGPYGNGPYRRWDCLHGQKAAEKVAAMVDELAALEPQFADGSGVESNGDKDGGAELNRAASHGGVSSGAAVDWAAFHDRREATHAAAKAGDYSQALREAGQAIRDLMKQVRANKDAMPDAAAGA